VSSDTPPSIPPRTSSGQGKKPGTAKPAGGRTATDTSARGTATTPKAGEKPGTGSSTTTKPGTAKPAGAAATSTAPRTGSTSGTASEGKPAAAKQAPAKPAATSSTASSSLSSGSGPRRVRLAISRVDPWSVMKLSFLMSVAIGIMIVVATSVVWLTLDSLQVFATVNGLVTEILADSSIDLMQYVEFDRVISVSVLVAVVDVLLITALATIGAFLYNITAALVGGVHVTMTDE
jgi:hypothetical protein